MAIPTVKRGDAAPLTLELGVDLSAYSSANVILRRASLPPVVISGVIDPGVGGIVTAMLPTTLPVGDYQAEVEMNPGPHTYPSEGYVVLSIVADLNPPA